MRRLVNEATPKLILQGVTEHNLQDLDVEIPLGRLGKSSELGATVCFLCSDGAGFITGHVLPHAGGWA